MKYSDAFDLNLTIVAGCKNNCPRCQVKETLNRNSENIAEREQNILGMDPTWKKYWKKRVKSFDPVFLYNEYLSEIPSKVSTVLLNPAGDIRYWSKKSMELARIKIESNPEKTFSFITKDPIIYLNSEFPRNVNLGIMIGNEDELKNAELLFDSGVLDLIDNSLFLYVSPLDFFFDPNDFFLDRFERLIVGMDIGCAMKWEWVMKIASLKGRTRARIWMEANMKNYCIEYGIPYVREPPAGVFAG